jgi:hypothetical protein
MQKRSFGKSGGALAPLFFGTVLKRAPIAEGMATVLKGHGFQPCRLDEKKAAALAAEGLF